MEQKIYKDILCVMDELGYSVFIEDDDFTISDYVIDSLQFINFIVCLEGKLCTELPDDFLSYESFQSARGLSNKIKFFIDTK